MSRSGYSYDLDEWAQIRWRGAVASAIRGKRGQSFLRELVVSLDAIPEKRLIAHKLEKDGEVCSLGAVGRMRGIDMQKVDPEDWEQVSAVFGISDALAREIMAENDESIYGTVDQESARWKRMRKWAVSHIRVQP